MVVNRFFSSVVRIQKDRGHTAVTTGPYRLVRHRGYLGWTLFNAATPIALDSLWALVPAGLTVGAIILSTALEDETLQRELDGYRDYARRVCYRLFPGLW